MIEKPVNMVDRLFNCEYSVLMEQLALFDGSRRWTVTDLTRYLRQLLESDTGLQDIWVQGEISNLSRPSSGHLYFTLKDSGAALRCVMWRKEAARLRFSLEDGMAIEAHGSLSIYETGGQYQLYADTLHPMGEGALYQEFLRRKKLLEAEGLFDLSRKRPIPDRPRRIGVVTSPTGAALRDILNTLRRRYSLAEVVLAPSPVQGDDAPSALVEAIRTLNRVVEPDVILLARGEARFEDLWAFNDENVVRAVSESVAPVITGVGHETDFTLVDFAADLRAPTPTAAAELATPITTQDLQVVLSEMTGVLVNALYARMDNAKSNLKDQATRLILLSPSRRLQSDRQRLDELNRQGARAQVHYLQLALERLKGLDSRLSTLNPSAVLQRGYAIVTRQADGAVVSRKSQVGLDDDLSIQVQDGEFGSRVSRIS